MVLTRSRSSHLPCWLLCLLADEVIELILGRLDASDLTRAVQACHDFLKLKLQAVHLSAHRFPGATSIRVLRIDLESRSSGTTKASDCRPTIAVEKTRSRLRLTASTATEWLWHVEQQALWIDELACSLACFSEPWNNWDFTQLIRLAHPPWDARALELRGATPKSPPTHVPPAPAVLVLHALQSLCDAPPPLVAHSCVPAVIKLMEDEDQFIRRAAVRVLARQDAGLLATHLESLLARLRDKDETVVAAALNALRNCPTARLGAHVHEVVALLKPNVAGGWHSAVVRFAALSVLAVLPVEAYLASAPDFENLVYDEDKSVAWAAAQVLRGCGLAWHEDRGRTVAFTQVRINGWTISLRPGRGAPFA